MFHWRDNTYFGRLDDGFVRVVKFSAPPYALMRHVNGTTSVVNEVFPDGEFRDVKVLLDVRIPPQEWASIIASVALGGGTAEHCSAARAFHDGAPLDSAMEGVVYKCGTTARGAPPLPNQCPEHGDGCPAVIGGRVQESAVRRSWTAAADRLPKTGGLYLVAGKHKGSVHALDIGLAFLFLLDTGPEWRSHGPLPFGIEFWCDAIPKAATAFVAERDAAK